jgi:hypothetical protein
MSQCIEWTKYKTPDGYGRLRFGGKLDYAHRVALMWKLGRALVSGAFAMHTCDNPGCVNQEHLIEGTPGENSRDRTAKGRHAKGKMLPHAKLSLELAERIRTLRDEGCTLVALSEMFGVSQSAVGQVCRMESWV